MCYNGRNVGNTLAPSFLMGSSPFLQVTRVTIKVWMSLNFSQMIPPLTMELAALKCLKKSTYTLVNTLVPGSSSFLQVTSWDEFELRPDRISDSGGYLCP